MALLGNNAELRQAVLDAVDDTLPGIVDTGDNGGLIDPDALVQDTALTLTSVAAAAVLLWSAISVMGALKRSIRAMFGIMVPRVNPVEIGRASCREQGVARAAVRCSYTPG